MSDVLEAHLALACALADQDHEAVGALVAADATIAHDAAGGIQGRGPEDALAAVAPFLDAHELLDLRPELARVWTSPDGQTLVTTVQLRLLAWSIAGARKVLIELGLGLVWALRDHAWQVVTAYPTSRPSVTPARGWPRLCRCPPVEGVPNRDLRQPHRRLGPGSAVRLLNPDSGADDAVARRFAYLEID